MIRQIRNVLFVLLIIILSSSLIGCTGRLAQLQNSLNNNNYSEAANQIKKITSEDERLQAIEMIKAKFEEIKEAFFNGTMDGTRAIANLQKFREINGVEDLLSKDIDEINSIMSSQKAFLDGARAEKENNYDLAYESYYNVSEADKTNYDKAQARLKDLDNVIKKSSPITVENSNIITNSKTQKNLYPDQMQVILKNNSNKTINNFTVSILGFDASGNEVKIQGKNNNQIDYEFLGSGDNIIIKPNKIWGSEYGWSLMPDNNLDKIIACVKDLKFTDGTSWHNPLYKPWLDKNMQNYEK